MKNLRDFAKQQTEFSPLTANREKGDMEAIIDKEVTLADCDKVEMPNEKTGELEQFYVFLIKEDTKNFYFSGKVLTELFDSIIANAMLDDLRREGLKVKFIEAKSKKSKQKYFKLEII